MVMFMWVLFVVLQSGEMLLMVELFGLFEFLFLFVGDVMLEIFCCEHTEDEASEPNYLYL